MTSLSNFPQIQTLLTTLMPKSMLAALYASSGVVAGWQLMDLPFPYSKSQDIMGKPSMTENQGIP
jgi:hypothetical protein